MSNVPFANLSAPTLLTKVGANNSWVPSRRLVINRAPNASPEIKDPSLVRLRNGRRAMYASVGRSDCQDWLVGRFIADTIAGPWTELEPCELVGISGPRVCAPAVLRMSDDYNMWIQTECFAPGGTIEMAYSTDGRTFIATGTAVPCEPHDTVYDVGASYLHDGRIALIHTACSRAGGNGRAAIGDLYLTLDGDTRLILAETDVSWHNQPDDPNKEWCLEGAQITQLAQDAYLLSGVCFLQSGAPGTRQRVFFARATSIWGPYAPLGMPLEPEVGENGHPDAALIGDELHLVYQERKGDGMSWHLRHAVFPIDMLLS